MIKSKLALSVAALLSIQVSQVCADRFLQGNRTNSTTGPLIAPAPSQNITVFNTSRPCGECILGGNIFCVRGPEQYSGSAPIQTICCQNKTSCPQVLDRAWNCSSIYENRTIAERLRVCPFDSNQCGSQSIQINDLGDAQCLRLRNVQRGNACLYRVRSQCGVPRFQVNDTSSSIFFSQIQLANTTNIQPAPLSDAVRCVAPRNQTCICRTFVDVGAGVNRTNVTRQVCDCETALNVTVANNSCSSCRILSDPLGNLLRQCTCSLVSPTQAFDDQYCQCQRVTDLVTRASSLNCTCAKPVPARFVSLPEESCKCVTSFNQNTRSTFLDCVCRNAPICQDPLSLLPVPPRPAPAPCDISYPCSCSALNVSANNSQNLQCNCTNPSTSLRAQARLSSNQCSCQLRITNNTWVQDCRCCLADNFVRTQLIPPVTCPANSIKQNCQCTNATVSRSNSLFSSNCQCTNAQTNVTVPGLVYFNDSTSCDCNDTNLGTKACRCCVGPQVLSVQLQPRCPVVAGNVSTLESCQCMTTANVTQRCDCLSRRFNNFTFPQVSVNATQCFCAPQVNGTNFRACNCCVSDGQFQQTRQVCPANRDASNCSCTLIPSTGNYNCDCVNRFFFNQVTQNVAMNASQCACYRPAVPANSTANSTVNTTVNARIPCTCCAGESDLVRLPRQCNDPIFDNLVRCNSCVNTTVNGARVYACNCNGTRISNNRTAAYINSLPVNTSNCGCVNFGNRSTCDCCISDFDWQQARPVCSSNQTSESCQCQNLTILTRYNVTTTNLVNRTTTFTCRPMGCSGEICGNVANGSINTTCRWNNSFACFSNAVCEYQNSTGNCGWTMTSNLTQCIARNASADPRLFQNLTTPRNATVRNITALVNNTVVQTLNFTNTSLFCNCSNSRYPRNPIINSPSSLDRCGCSNALSQNRSCDCCFDRQTIDNFVLASQTCRAANTTLSNCSCTNNMTCNCAAPFTSNLFYNGLQLNASNCSCVNRGNSSLNECRCCLPTIQAALVPAAPQCGFNSDTLACTCDANFRCSCNNGTVNRTVQTNQTVIAQIFNATTNRTQNVTQIRVVNSTFVDNVFVNQTLPQSQCGCLNILNGTTTIRQCNCCVQRPLSCANTTVDVQSCSCSNVTNATSRQWQWNCSCLRRDTNIRSNLTFPLRTACSTDPFTGVSQCCVSRPQFDSQVPTLTCSASSQRQSCQCSNTTDPVTRRVNLVCGCTRIDNGVLGSFQFTPDNCLRSSSANSTNFTCCVAPELVATQFPRKSCIVEGNGTLPQFCDCTTLNFTVNGTRTILNNCNCSRPEFLAPRNFNFSQTACLCQPGNRSCECCVSPAQRLAMIPQVQCSPSDATQFGCSCRNVTNNVTGRIDQTCSCNTNYLGKIYTIANLTSQRNGCVCNGTACGCCISNAVVIAATEKVCLANETRSVCSCSNGTLNSATRKLNYNCTCTTFTRDFTVLNFTYNSLTEDQCLCRGQSNCTCCVAGRNPAPTQPVCNAPNATATVALPICQCATPINSSQLCNCTRVNGSVETYNNNIRLGNCNCMAVANRTNGGRAPFECSCCATPAQVAAPAPVCGLNQTVEQCSCLNINDVRGRRGYNCDCRYQGIANLRELNFPNESQCGCANTNTLLKSCGCCISTQQYRDAITPRCDVLGTCITQSRNGTLIGNCSAVRGNTTFVNANMNLNQSQCGCFNDELGRQICRCCMTGAQDITRVPERQCRAADQLPSNCDCPVFGVNQTTANCSCSVRSQGFSYSFPGLRQNISDCQCIQITNGTSTRQQCSCCSPRSLIVNLQSPVCNSPQMSLQRCNCRANTTRNAISDVCDCPRQPSLPVSLSRQCSCLNQTSSDGSNTQNCTCCVQNPPLTVCERLSLPNADMIGCRCSDIIVNGRATFSCNCTRQVNTTTVLTRNNMIYDEARECCCVERQDPISRRGFKQCNCSHPVVTQVQACQCRAMPGLNVTSPNSTANCSCQDCNRVVQNRTLPLNRCQCMNYPQFLVPAAPIAVNGTNNASTRVNTTNSTLNATTRPAPLPAVIQPQAQTYNCTCQVDFQGLCPQLDITRQRTVDEFTCAASSNRPSPVKTLSDCGNSYEYLVAVVSTERNSSVLMQVQSQQFMGALSLQISMMMVIAAASLMLSLFY